MAGAAVSARLRHRSPQVPGPLPAQALYVGPHREVYRVLWVYCGVCVINKDDLIIPYLIANIYLYTEHDNICMSLALNGKLIPSNQWKNTADSN